MGLLQFGILCSVSLLKKRGEVGGLLVLFFLFFLSMIEGGLVGSIACVAGVGVGMDFCRGIFIIIVEETSRSASLYVGCWSWFL